MSSSLLVLQAHKHTKLSDIAIIKSKPRKKFFAFLVFAFFIYTSVIPDWDNHNIPVRYNNVKALYADFQTAMRLKELRKKKNISQLKLALDLNMNQNSISRYENGEREADYCTLIKLADYFNVSLDYLLERSDNPSMNE